MDNKLINIFAKNFFNTFYFRCWNDEIQDPVSELSIEESYAVQDMVSKKKLGRGEQLAGYKISCTSQAIRSQFHLNEPIFGRLFKPHIFDDGVVLNWKEYSNCAIEPEMVLKMKKDLKGEDLPDEVLTDAIEYISPGIEIHNFKFWYEPPTLQELICSNGIHAGLVVGASRISPENLMFKSEKFKVYKDDNIITEAEASEIMGGPLNSLRWLIGKLTSCNKILKAGSFVIPGSPVELINIYEDTELKISIDKVGEAVVYFKS